MLCKRSIGGSRRLAHWRRASYGSRRPYLCRCHRPRLRDGLEAFDMDVLAARVHCSRATIYRYAGGKAQIRDAVLLRLAARIVESVRRAVKDLSGAERVVKA